MQRLYIKTVTIHYLGPWIDNHFRFKKNNLIFGINNNAGGLDVIEIIKLIKDIRKKHRVEKEFFHENLINNPNANFDKCLLKITYFNSKKDTYIKVTKDGFINYKYSKNLNSLNKIKISCFETKEDLEEILNALNSKKDQINYLKNRIVIFLKIENIISESKIKKILDFSYKYSGQTFFSTISPKIIVHAVNNFDTKYLDVFYMVNHFEKNKRPDLLQQLTEYTGKKINKKILFVEGISDRLIIESIAKKNRIKDLIIIDVGGIANINFDAIAKLNHFLTAKAIIDHDNEIDRKSNRLIHVLTRTAIEWYLDQNILRKYALNDFRMSSHNKILMAENFKNTYLKSQNYRKLEKEFLNLYNSF
ncbi:MAG: hypothetical protein HPPSJP_2410 [Candidatus Hepatoplasma scabrum]|nr:MAG: hypothetical protein HPPSJP_2410 [Candidatus Hepatoplasma sp.]